MSLIPSVKALRQRIEIKYLGCLQPSKKTRKPQDQSFRQYQTSKQLAAPPPPPSTCHDVLYMRVMSLHQDSCTARRIATSSHNTRGTILDFVIAGPQPIRVRTIGPRLAALWHLSRGYGMTDQTVIRGAWRDQSEKNRRICLPSRLWTQGHEQVFSR